MLLDIFGYIASVTMVIIYFGMTRKWWSPKVFDWGNAIAVYPIAASAISHEAYVPLILTVTFGVVGTVAVIQQHLYKHQYDWVRKLDQTWNRDGLW